MNQQCKVCGEPAAGFHFGAFTCEGCKSFFGRTYNNLSSISECKNNGECVINKKNRTACKACRLRKCLLVGMSKSGSRYGRRSNWFKIHCLLQEQQQAAQAAAAAASQSQTGGPIGSQTSSHPGVLSPALDIQKTLAPPHPDLAGFFAQTFAHSLHQTAAGSPFLSPLYRFPPGLTIQQLQDESTSTSNQKSSAASDSGTSSAEDETEQSSSSRLKMTDHNFFAKRFHPYHNNNNNNNNNIIDNNGLEKKFTVNTSLTRQHPISPSSDPGCFYGDKTVGEKQFSPPPSRVTVSSLSWPNTFPNIQNGIGCIDPNALKDLWLRTLPTVVTANVVPVKTVTDNVKNEDVQDEPIDLSVKHGCNKKSSNSDETISDKDDDDIEEISGGDNKEGDHKVDEATKTVPLDLTLENSKRNEIVSS